VGIMVATLAYELLYKERLEIAPSIYKIPFLRDETSTPLQNNTGYILDINKCDSIKKDVKNRFEKIKEDFIEYLKKTFADKTIDLEVANKVIDTVKIGEFTTAFRFLSNSNPQIFFDVVASSQIRILLNEFNNRFEELMSSLKQRAFLSYEICSITLLGYLASSIDDRNIVKYKPRSREIFQALSDRNLDGIVYLINRIEFNKFFEDENPNDIYTILKKVAVLPYYLLEMLKLYKLGECYKLKEKIYDTSIDIEELANKFGCIFSSTTLSIECLFEKGPLFKEGSLFKEIVSKEGATLYNIEEFIQKIKGKRVTDYLSQMRSMCESGEKKKCYIFLDRFKENAQTPPLSLHGLCEDKLYEKVVEFCPNPLQECPLTEKKVLLSTPRD
jgi:hypothetical protein